MIQARFTVALETVEGRPVDVVDGHIGAALVAVAGGIADMVLARLPHALQAQNGFPVNVVGADLLIALAAVGSESLQSQGSNLPEAAFTFDGSQLGSVSVSILATDRASLGVGTFVGAGDHDVATVAVPGDQMDVTCADFASTQIARGC